MSDYRQRQHTGTDLCQRVFGKTSSPPSTIMYIGIDIFFLFLFKKDIKTSNEK